MVLFLIGSHVFQVLGGPFFQRDTNGVNRDVGSFQICNLRASVPIAITLGFAAATGGAIRNEDHIAGTVGLLRSRAPIEIIIGLLQSGSIVGAAFRVHGINFARNVTQVISQGLLDSDSFSILGSAIVVPMCEADNSHLVASGSLQNGLCKFLAHFFGGIHTYNFAFFTDTVGRTLIPEELSQTGGISHSAGRTGPDFVQVQKAIAFRKILFWLAAWGPHACTHRARVINHQHHIRIGLNTGRNRIALHRQFDGVAVIRIHHRIAFVVTDQRFGGLNCALLQRIFLPRERCRGQDTHDHHDRKEQRPKTFLHVLSFLLYFPLIRVCMCSFRNCGISLWHTPPEKIRRSLFSPFDSKKV